MQVLKDYYLWVILVVIFVGLVAFELVFVRGVRSQTEQEHQAVVSTLGEGQRLSQGASNIPTLADMAAARSHLERIQGERDSIRRIWRQLTGGLNSYMSNGQREDGTVADPETGEPLRWELFGFRLRDLYGEMFDAVRYEYAQQVRERLEEGYARQRKLSVAGISDEAARAWAERRAEDESFWWTAQYFDSGGLVPFDQFRTFTAEERWQGWIQWRTFLIKADILGRVVPAAVAEVPRPVLGWARGPDGLIDPAAGAAVHEITDWRFVEKVARLSVIGPRPGTSVLPGPEIEEGSPEFTRALSGVGNADSRYYDIYTVHIEMNAHPAVVRAFMKEILRSEKIWYVPESVRIEKLSGVQPPRIPKGYATRETPLSTPRAPVRDPFSGAATPGGGGRRPGAGAEDMWETDTFGYQPPVNAVLQYQVYRFRYTDTDNPTRSQLESERVTNF